MLSQFDKIALLKLTTALKLKRFIMAYMNQEIKKRLVSEVKKVLPKGWKLSFAVQHYSTIVCTIRQAPIDISKYLDGRSSASINPYHVESDKQLSDEVKEVLSKIIKALNSQNHDNSDSMTDYFDVGYYLDLRFGKWDKPFVSTLENKSK